jgi:hypothetical protein
LKVFGEGAGENENLKMKFSPVTGGEGGDVQAA